MQQAGPDGRLTGIDAGRNHLDKHLVGRGHRAFHLVNAKNIHVAVVIESHRSCHAPSLVPPSLPAPSRPSHRLVS